MFECFFLTRTGLCHEKNKDNVSVTQIRILFTESHVQCTVQNSIPRMTR